MIVAQEDFEAAAEEVKTFKKVSQADQLILYSFYKQATVGDCDGSEFSRLALSRCLTQQKGTPPKNTRA
jgi:acyl-CoA-binding protein